jgi:hypothetical protein
MARPATIDRAAALEALWGKSSADAAAELGCSAPALRYILHQQPKEVQEAYRVARLARQILRWSRCPTIRAITESTLIIARQAADGGLRAAEAGQDDHAHPIP